VRGPKNYTPAPVERHDVFGKQPGGPLFGLLQHQNLIRTERLLDQGLRQKQIRGAGLRVCQPRRSGGAGTRMDKPRDNERGGRQDGQRGLREPSREQSENT